MSDQSPPPPKPKPGSLRDRIAAFEKPAATNTTPSPVPRPKPGGISWKPKQPSPPGSPDTSSSGEQPKRFGGGMSASDAKESIGKGGGSLKERMAALQGKGAFGAPAPPPIAPKPAVEKPKWKPPPPVASPTEEGEDKPADQSGEAPATEEPSRSKSPPVAARLSGEESSKVSVEEDGQASQPEGQEGEVDPEEEERQRRAAIAARMARLGGARVGMGPPVFGKPAYKKPEASKEEAPKAEELPAPNPVEPEAIETTTETQSLKSPPVEEPEAPGSIKTEEGTKPDYFAGEPKSSDSSLLSPESNTSTGPSPRTPGSMPLPTAPRRAGPPRRKAKSPAPLPVEERQAEAKETPEPLVSDESAAAAELVPQQNVDAGDKEPEIGVVSTSANDAQPMAGSEGPAQVLKDEPLVEEPPVDDVHLEEFSVTGEPRALSIEETPIPSSKVDSKVDSGKPEVVEEPLKAAPAPTSPASVEPTSAPVEEEDEDARRKRVAERLAKMGGVNPFALPPQRKPSLLAESGDMSATSPPASAKRTSMSSTSESFSPPPVRRSSQASATSTSSAARKASVGSTHMDESEEKLARKSSLDDQGVDVSAPAHVGITEGPEEQDEIEHEEPAYNYGKSSSTSEMLDDGIDPEDLHGHEDLEEEPSAEVETPREAFPPPLPRIATRPIIAASPATSDDVSDLDTGYIPPPPTALSADTDDEPGVSKHLRSIPWPPPRDDAEDEDEDDAPPVPPPRRSMPPPPRMIPQPVEDEYNAEAEQEDDEAQEPASVMRRESLPRTIASDRESPQEAPRRLPPRPVLDDDGSESDVPLPHPSHRSVPPPAESPVHDTMSEDDSPPKPIPSSRPMRFVPPPPPPSVPPTTAEEEEETYDKPAEDEEILPTPPRGSLPTEQSPAEDEPLIIPPPPPRPDTTLPVPIAQRRMSAQPTQLLPSVAPEQAPPIATPTLSVSGHSNDRELEILDEEEGDPIDPSFHSPPSRTSSFANLHEDASSPATCSAAEAPPAASEPEPEPVEDEEQVRRRTIAERMAKLGGIKFGAAPIPMSRPPPPLLRQQEKGETGNEGDAEEGAEEKPELTEEEEERIRKERIAAKLASMGGMRIGMSPFGMVPPRAAPAASPAPSTIVTSPPPPSLAARHPPPPQRSAPPPVPQALSQSQEFDSEHGSQATSEDGVKVEAEESEMEELNFEDAQEQEEAPPPPVPSRGGRRTSVQSSPEQRTQSLPARPPVPAGISVARRTSVQAPRKSSVDSGPAQFPRQFPTSTRVPQSQSDYVMVEESDGVEAEVAPPPPPRLAGRPPPRGVPPPPQSASDMPESISSQWELPSIPSVDFGTTADLSLSWTDDIASPSAPPPPEKLANVPPSSQAPPAVKAPVDQVLSADDLMTIWGRVGVQICESANALHEKSKRALIGDSTYYGFVDAVLKEVPNAAPIAPDSLGYLIYQQSGGSVQKRASEIMGGDIVWMHDAKLKGHKGIQTYHQTVGSPEPLVGIVSDFEAKKFKVRVFQANQHVGQQTVESASYRLEDLKSGTVKVFRVLEA